ncbi:MAG: hypothetical protein ABSC54_00665 [Smithellaceae bacterium]|jgi:hypothetical protein
MKKILNDRYGGLANHLNRRDAWAEGIIDGFEAFFKSAGLKKVTWFIIGFAVCFFGRVIFIIINR